MSRMELELPAQEISSQALEASVADSPGLHRMLTMKDLQEFVPYSARHIDRLVEKGEFPAPLYISPNRRIWLEPEVRAWQREKALIGQHKRNYSTKKKAA